jgi:hypothetical protein
MLSTAIVGLNKEFDSSEHKSLGNVQLPGLPRFTRFIFPGGARLTFGEIIALAGDYFGIALEPISQGITLQDKKNRFLAAYSTLAQCSPADVERLTNEFVTEADAAISAIADEKSETAGIDEVTANETEIALESTKGNFLILAEHNLDHFNKQALDAFETGYMLAMQAALDASMLSDQTAKQNKLAYAYALLAFACHFMTDLFASGHMRTPRANLEAQFGAEIGSLLSLFQHNEDGDSGLEVTANDAIWRAYGDGHLFEKKSKENQDRALQAVQVAVNEIHQVFLEQKLIPLSQSTVLKLIPTPTETNLPPMFKLSENAKLLCRIPIKAETSNNYAELTRTKALEILVYHAEIYLEQSIAERITAGKKILENLEKRLQDDYTKLQSQSIFSHPDPIPNNYPAQPEMIQKRCCAML